jgi:hypothetical protein
MLRTLPQWLRCALMTATPKSSSRGGWFSVVLALAFAASAVAASTVIATAVGVRTVMCDGTVPIWWIPDDYAGSGCVEMPPWWEMVLPGHDTTMVCLGLCPPGVEAFHR